MAVLALQTVPAEQGKHLWQCWSPTGLDLSLSRKALEQPPPLAAWVTAVYNAAVSRVGGGDVSFTESIKSCSSASCVRMALGTADVRESATPEAQQRRAAAVVAGRQSDGDKDKRTDLERTCPSKLEGVYEYTALVERWYDDGLYASFPDIRVTGVEAATIEDVTRDLKERLLMYFEEVALGNFQAPPARFMTLDDFEKVKGYSMSAEDRENFHSLLPFKVTLEETRAWMAQKCVDCDPYWLDPY